MSHSSAFADEYDSDYSTGYESYVQGKPRKETRRKPTKARRETRGRLTDAMSYWSYHLLGMTCLVEKGLTTLSKM